MKLKIFIVLLIIFLCSLNTNYGYACGDIYFQDENRFHILKPKLFIPSSYSMFYYTASEFGEQIEESPNESEIKNCKIWQKRSNIMIEIESVYKAIYTRDKIDSNNQFIRFLILHKDHEALNYLEFAKSCEFLNTHLTDPWERNEITKNIPFRNRKINEAINYAKQVKDKTIAKRYIFLALRLMFYNEEIEKLKTVYKIYFNRKPEDIIDYWAMHFYTLSLEEGIEKNRLAAIVFLNASDKRYSIHYAYSNKILFEETLKSCKNKEEKAAVWLLHAVRKTGRAKESIIEIYHNHSKSDALTFLLARELSKLEDWIFTPYYTQFSPSIYSDLFKVEIESQSIKNNRMLRDIKYAKELLELVTKINPYKTINPDLILFAKAELQMMVSEHQNSINSFALLLNKKKINIELKKLINEFIVLNKIHLLSDSIEMNKQLEIEIMTLGDKVLFAVARELEYKKSYTESAYLLSKVYEMNWIKNKKLEIEYFSNYFDYIDYTYTNNQLKKFISDFENLDKKTPYNLWKSTKIQNDYNKLLDLLGTKYIRTNELFNALKTFKKVDKEYLVNEHSYDLNVNPFYANFYSEHNANPADSITYTKTQIVEKLIFYLKKANNPKEKHRDYYYQLIGNCYFNMSKHGNAWAMRRFGWSITDRNNHFFPDNEDYINCKKAKTYYLKASALSKDREFSALNLRMAGKCEKFTIIERLDKNEYDNDYQKILFNQNQYYKQLKLNFPDLYQEIISNCNEHERIYKKRLLNL